MISKIKQVYRRMSLTPKIRWSYAVILIPILGFVMASSIIFFRANSRYDTLIRSVAGASEFSLDFQKDYDYETYLVIVGNETPEESRVSELLEEANRIVGVLAEITDSPENLKTLESVSKYLKNLTVYKSRIEENLAQGNLYEANMEIWENDVQIVTALIRETMITYVYGETRELQAAQAEYKNFYVRISTSLAVILLMILAFVAAASYYIPIDITRTLRELCVVTDRIADGDLTVRALVAGGEEERALSTSLNTMATKINDLIDQVTEEQKHLRRSEFELLQAQINPHFLYNTLDAIMWLIDAGEREQAVNMVRNLSDFFRTSLNQGREIITIREELRHVESYLEIQRTRYQDILDYEIDVPEQLYNFTIPKLTLQPLVENALYHGIKNKRGGGKIRITGRLKEECLVLTVSDNGTGMESERLQQVNHAIEQGTPDGSDIYGVYNVNERIRLYVGEEYGLTISSVFGEGTTSEVTLPQK